MLYTTVYVTKSCIYYKIFMDVQLFLVFSYQKLLDAYEEQNVEAYTDSVSETGLYSMQ